MSELPPVTRIITTHTEDGRSTAKVEQLEIPSVADKGFPGVNSRVFWTTESVPTNDNNTDIDGATREVPENLGLVSEGGTVCTITELAPGAVATWHRTTSLDHNVLISGQMILMLEDGTEHLVDQPGSVIIQRGTMHAWKNPGPGWTRWMCVLVDANPAVVNGKSLGTEVRLA